MSLNNKNIFSVFDVIRISLIVIRVSWETWTKWSPRVTENQVVRKPIHRCVFSGVGLHFEESLTWSGFIFMTNHKFLPSRNCIILLINLSQLNEARQSIQTFILQLVYCLSLQTRLYYNLPFFCYLPPYIFSYTIFNHVIHMSISTCTS